MERGGGNKELLRGDHTTVLHNVPGGVPGSNEGGRGSIKGHELSSIPSRHNNALRDEERRAPLHLQRRTERRTEG